MAPTIGRIVLVKLRENGQPWHVNGADEHPAIVTEVHGKTVINCRVFQDDDGVPIWLTSVPLDTGEGDYDGPSWRWPPRN